MQVGARGEVGWTLEEQRQARKQETGREFGRPRFQPDKQKCSYWQTASDCAWRLQNSQNGQPVGVAPTVARSGGGP